MSGLITRSSADMLPARLVRLQRTLQSCGWDLRTVDIDLVGESCRVELMRRDGLLVTLDANSVLRRGTITREYSVSRRITVGAGGCVSNRGGLPSDRVSMQLLGRSHVSGMRSGIKALAHYVADNTDSPIGRLVMRDSFRALLTPEER